jgi:hypothetical protein
VVALILISGAVRDQQQAFIAINKNWRTNLAVDDLNDPNGRQRVQRERGELARSLILGDSTPHEKQPRQHRQTTVGEGVRTHARESAHRIIILKRNADIGRRITRRRQKLAKAPQRLMTSSFSRPLWH